MAIAFVQSKGAQSSGAVGSLGVLFDASTATGNLIAVGVTFYQVGTYTVTDGTNTYTQDKTITDGGGGGNNTATVWHTYETSGGSRTVTVTNTGGNKYTSVGLAEFSGVDSGVAPSTNSKEDTTTPTGAGSVTSATDGSLYFACLVFGSGGTCTPDSPFTTAYENESASNQPISTVYHVQTTAAALEPTWTMGTSPQAMAACVAVFSPSSGGGGGVVIPIIVHHRKMQGAQ